MFSPLGSTASLLTFCFYFPQCFFSLCLYVWWVLCWNINSVFPTRASFSPWQPFSYLNEAALTLLPQRRDEEAEREKKTLLLPFEYFCYSWHEPRFKRMKNESGAESPDTKRKEEQGMRRCFRSLGKGDHSVAPSLKERTPCRHLGSKCKGVCVLIPGWKCCVLCLDRGGAREVPTA